MKNSFISLWDFSRANAVKHHARIMQLPHDRGFVICSNSKERLSEVWPLLQHDEPRLLSSSTSSACYGHAFCLHLWPEIRNLLDLLTEIYTDPFWRSNFRGGWEECNKLRSLAYLQGVLRETRGADFLPPLSESWWRAHSSTPDNVTTLLSWDGQTPGEKWLRDWAQGQLPNRKILVSPLKKEEGENVLFLPTSPISPQLPCKVPSLLTKKPVEAEIDLEQERKRAEMRAEMDEANEDMRQRFRHDHTPIEDLFGNDNGRRSERRLE